MPLTPTLNVLLVRDLVGTPDIEWGEIQEIEGIGPETSQDTTGTELLEHGKN